MKTSFAQQVILAAVTVVSSVGNGNAQDAKNTNTVAQLSPVIVEAQRLPQPKWDRPYTTTNIHSATWTGVPIDKTPVTAQVIPRQVIEDQASDRIKDVVRNVAGVSQVKTEGRGIQFEEYNIRGFSQRAMLAGFTLYAMPVINLAGVEQVEVLKGPSSSLYGAIEPGGMVNIIPKLPQFESRTTIYGEIGSYNHYRSGIDSTGPIDSNTAYRVVCDYENSDSYRNYLNKEAFFCAPSLTWIMPDQTRITAWMWYQHLDRPVDNGITFDSTGHPIGKASQNFASSSDNSQSIDDITSCLQLEHPVNNDFTVYLRYLYHYFDGQYDAIRLQSKTANKLTPYYDNSSFHNDEHDILDYAVWRFDLGPTEHHLLFGTEVSASDYHYYKLTDNTLSPFSIYNPVYPTGPYHPTAGSIDQITLTKVAAGYVQDQVDLLDDKMHLLAGGRSDYVDRFNRSTDNSRYSAYDMGYSGRGGAMYDLTEWMSPYTTISRSFNPTTGATVTGDMVDPTTGVQYEGGTKFKFFQKKLQITTAAFQTTKDDVAVKDEVNSTSTKTYYMNGGKMRSEGAEVSALGQITKEWQVVGSYAYTDTRVIQSSSLPVGASLVNVPLNSGSLWLKYTLQDGPLNGLGAGVGCFAEGESEGDNNNTFELPGYVRWDTGVWYSRKVYRNCMFKIQCNVLNVFDKEYYESSSGTASVQPGTPRYFVTRASLTF
jgi:iron complex outermembrane receptor protein